MFRHLTSFQIMISIHKKRLTESNREANIVRLNLSRNICEQNFLRG
jgi:hypothetical protein